MQTRDKVINIKLIINVHYKRYQRTSIQSLIIPILLPVINKSIKN